MKHLSERIPTAVRSPPDNQDSPMVAPSPYYAASPVRRSAPGLPFGWGAVTVLLVGAALLILGILLILYGFLSFLTGTIGQATSSSFSVPALFQSILVSDNVVSLRSFVSVKRSCLVRPYSCSHSDSVGLM